MVNTRSGILELPMTLAMTYEACSKSGLDHRVEFMDSTNAKEQP